MTTNPRRVSIPLAAALWLLPAMAGAMPVSLLADGSPALGRVVTGGAWAWGTEAPGPAVAVSAGLRHEGHSAAASGVLDDHDPLFCPVGPLLPREVVAGSRGDGRGQDGRDRITPLGPWSRGRGPWWTDGPPRGSWKGSGETPPGQGTGTRTDDPPSPDDRGQDPQQVPEPAATLVVGSGLLALGLWRRRKEA